MYLYIYIYIYIAEPVDFAVQRSSFTLSNASAQQSLSLHRFSLPFSDHHFHIMPTRRYKVGLVVKGEGREGKVMGGSDSPPLTNQPYI